MGTHQNAITAAGPCPEPHVPDPQPGCRTWGSAGVCRAGCPGSALPLEKDSDLQGTGGSSTLPVCLAWASGELWLVFLNLSSTCIGELEDITVLVGKAGTRESLAVGGL